jgi:hypothetical protein
MGLVKRPSENIRLHPEWSAHAERDQGSREHGGACAPALLSRQNQGSHIASARRLRPQDRPGACCLYHATCSRRTALAPRPARQACALTAPPARQAPAAAGARARPWSRRARAGWAGTWPPTRSSRRARRPTWVRSPRPGPQCSAGHAPCAAHISHAFVIRMNRRLSATCRVTLSRMHAHPLCVCLHARCVLHAVMGCYRDAAGSADVL